MARPSNAQLEAEDPFGTREAVRLGRKHMRALSAKLEKADSATRSSLQEQFVQIWQEMRASEKHHADLLRNPPLSGGKPAKSPK